MAHWLLSDFIKSVFYTNTIPILYKANYTQQSKRSEVKICLRVSHGKALRLILEITQEFCHETYGF